MKKPSAQSLKMTEFSPVHISLINQSREYIQALQKQQSMAYDALLLNLPDMVLETNTKEMIFDYVLNNETHTLTLDEKGLRVEPIFGGE